MNFAERSFAARFDRENAGSDHGIKRKREIIEDAKITAHEMAILQGLRGGARLGVLQKLYGAVDTRQFDLRKFLRETTRIETRSASDLQHFVPATGWFCQSESEIAEV